MYLCLHLPEYCLMSDCPHVCLSLAKGFARYLLHSTENEAWGRDVALLMAILSRVLQGKGETLQIPSDPGAFSSTNILQQAPSGCSQHLWPFSSLHTHLESYITLGQKHGRVPDLRLKLCITLGYKGCSHGRATANNTDYVVLFKAGEMETWWAHSRTAGLVLILKGFQGVLTLLRGLPKVQALGVQRIVV